MSIWLVIYVLCAVPFALLFAYVALALSGLSEPDSMDYGYASILGIVASVVWPLSLVLGVLVWVNILAVRKMRRALSSGKHGWR